MGFTDRRLEWIGRLCDKWRGDANTDRSTNARAANGFTNLEFGLALRIEIERGQIKRGTEAIYRWLVPSLCIGILLPKSIQ